MRLIDLFTSGVHTTEIARRMGRGVGGIFNRTRKLRQQGALSHLLTVGELAVIFNREHSGMVRIIRSGLMGPPVVLGGKYAWALEKSTLTQWCMSDASFGLDLDRIPPSKWRMMLAESREGVEILTPREYARRFHYDRMYIYALIRDGKVDAIPHVGGRGREYRIVIRKEAA